MSTSIHRGMTDPYALLYGVDSSPVETALMRDGVANNLLHAADSFAQVRVNYAAIAASLAGGVRRGAETIDSAPTAGEWYELGGQPFDSWPLTMHADGRPYLLRIRLGAAANATNGTVTITWRVFLAPVGRQVEELHRFADHVWEASSAASTTALWISGATQGSAGHATVLELDAPTASRWVQRVSTYDAVAGASPTTIEQLLVGLYVYAKTDNASVLPRLHNLYAAEFVG